jgi:hypothetical protein
VTFEVRFEPSLLDIGADAAAVWKQIQRGAVGSAAVIADRKHMGDDPEPIGLEGSAQICEHVRVTHQPGSLCVIASG